ncbi:MAG: hypothetical protein JNM94_16690 [Phycisphaerae bacterium]|nr:hypothetical protein [Phycisphaerae bacterium]
MWTCPTCGEAHDDQFDACWRCTGRAKDAEAPAPIAPPTLSPWRCLRCPTVLQFLGTRNFHEGAPWGAIGNLGELLVRREQFDVYVCPRCGHVEFFLHALADDIRAAEGT